MTVRAYCLLLVLAVLVILYVTGCASVQRPRQLPDDSVCPGSCVDDCFSEDRECYGHFYGDPVTCSGTYQDCLKGCSEDGGYK